MTTRNDTPIRFISYWETAPGRTIPPYVALAIASMRRVLGDAFLLLTPESLPVSIRSEIQGKPWGFSPLGFDFPPEIASIVAKSDYIRMAYVYEHGGAWLDADTLLLRNPSASLFPDGLTPKLHWYSEAVFGSEAGNPILGEAVSAAKAQDAHVWGNPGGIKDLVAAWPERLVRIPEALFDPGYRPAYCFSTCDVMGRKDIRVEAFLTNETDILKLYNTYFARTLGTKQSVGEFLASGMLLAKLFLQVEPDARYWIEMTEILTRGSRP